jgi:hypothetical protein
MRRAVALLALLDGRVTPVDIAPGDIEPPCLPASALDSVFARRPVRPHYERQARQTPRSAYLQWLDAQSEGRTA